MILTKKGFIGTPNPIQPYYPLTTWNEALQSIINGEEGIINVNILGDSLTLGGTSGDNESLDMNSHFYNGFVQQLNRKFAALIGDDVGRGVIPSTVYIEGSVYTKTGTSLNAYGFTGQNVELHEENDSISCDFNGNGLNLYFTKMASDTTVDLYIDSVKVKTITVPGNASRVIYTETITDLEDGEHTFELLKPSSVGYIEFLGFMELKGSCGVRFNIMGVSGYAANSGASSNAINAETDTTWGDGLTIIAYGLNDYKIQESLSTFRSYLQTIITAAKSRGDVILLYPSIRDISTVQSPKSIQQVEYIEVMKALSRINDIPFINNFEILGSDYTTAYNAGYIGNTVHLSGQGHSDLADYIYNLLTTFL
jgi:hypothetical protein